MKVQVRGRLIGGRIYIDANDLMLWIMSAESDTIDKKELLNRIEDYVKGTAQCQP